MKKIPVIAIFDIGKTNKKLFLFDENYQLVFDRNSRLPETKDADGFPCEDFFLLKQFIVESLNEIAGRKDFKIAAINFSAYGATLVNLDANGDECTPIYNYLKPYPEDLKKQFYNSYGGEEAFSIQTASPVLGSLNSGMQLYRTKYQKPEIFSEIKYSLHLPQYCSYLVSGKFFSEITSIGCHTNLWDFKKGKYHSWVQKEAVSEKLAPIVASSHVHKIYFEENEIPVGVGLHDSSAALIPYLVNFKEPFVLISTGTWCISLNPFNDLPLTKEELKNDCLSYLTHEAKPVKASRLFAGNYHDRQLERICSHFHEPEELYGSMNFNPAIFHTLQQANAKKDSAESVEKNAFAFAERDLSGFVTGEEAYHQLIFDIISQQFFFTNLILEGTAVKRIFVDGGFANNDIYMNALAIVFPGMNVFSACIPNASALGAAISIHNSWNKNDIPKDIIELKPFSPYPFFQ